MGESLGDFHVLFLNWKCKPILFAGRKPLIMFRVAFYYRIPWLLFFLYNCCRCSLTTVMDTKHALGLTTDDGADILIHVGLDTVKLNGAPFTLRFW